ncbi:hypothetical protein RJT34_07310 [Clitoria ternatea]|uniref:Uncharacterized protein n=1 Tax=Clitoria ternatea TaxID=43366 RepID=A0AAN9K3B6_CLITE
MRFPCLKRYCKNTVSGAVFRGVKRCPAVRFRCRRATCLHGSETTDKTQGEVTSAVGKTHFPSAFSGSRVKPHPFKKSWSLLLQNAFSTSSSIAVFLCAFGASCVPLLFLVCAYCGGSSFVSLVKDSALYKNFNFTKERYWMESVPPEFVTLIVEDYNKFKHFKIQCGATQSPTRSPVVHLWRRKTTLRSLLSRRRRESSLRRGCLLEKKKGGDQVRRHSLKDLFLSSPPNDESVTVTNEDKDSSSTANTGLPGSEFRPGSPKPGWTGFRCRSLLSKKPWRPILLTIDE